MSLGTSLGGAVDGNPASAGDTELDLWWEDSRAAERRSPQLPSPRAAVTMPARLESVLTTRESRRKGESPHALPWPEAVRSSRDPSAARRSSF